MPPRCRLRNHRYRTDLLTCTSSTWRRFPRRNPAAIIHCRSVSLFTSTARSFAKYSQAGVGPKSPYFAFTSFSALARRLSAKRRFDARPRSRCTIPPSPSFFNRTSNFLTQRSVTPNCAAAAPCVKCPCFNSCNTLNRSRSVVFITSNSCLLIRPVCRFSTGTFYFAGIGTSHFVAIQTFCHLDKALLQAWCAWPLVDYQLEIQLQLLASLTRRLTE